MKRILTSLLFSTVAIIALGEHPMAILYGRRNRSAQISAMTNGAVKVNADYTGKDDFLETDYHE